MNPLQALPKKAHEEIARALALFPQVNRVNLFGSRAKGTHKPGSDIDLAISGHGLDWRTIGRIQSALEDLPLPYRFSVIRHDASTDKEVSAHIARVGITIYDRELAHV